MSEVEKRNIPGSGDRKMKDVEMRNSMGGLGELFTVAGACGVKLL